jgi:hypothetical protein
MKLFEASNGYVGYSYTRCLIIAENEDRARELATINFKIKALEDVYEEDYWNDLEIICIADDVDKEFVGKIQD